jgi:hypothetical protein
LMPTPVLSSREPEAINLGSEGRAEPFQPASQDDSSFPVVAIGERKY